MFRFFLMFLPLLAWLSVPAAAQAAPAEDSDEGFEVAALNDAELNDLRGGFKFGPMMVHFSYNAVAQSIDVANKVENIQSVSFDSRNIQSANINPGLIIQNSQNQMILNIVQNFNIVTENAQLASTLSQMSNRLDIGRLMTIR